MDPRRCSALSKRRNSCSQNTLSFSHRLCATSRSRCYQSTPSRTRTILSNASRPVTKERSKRWYRVTGPGCWRRRGGSWAMSMTLSTWLHRIVVNAALMQLRSRRRRPELPIEELLPRFDDAGRWVDESEQTGWVDEHPIHRRETRQMVRRCIDQLPEIHRSVLLLRDIADLDTAEVAGMLAISSNAIKIRLHRARQALRSLIERERSAI